MTFSRMIKELKSNEYKIVVVGLDNSGKTTIIHKLFNQPIEKISPTFGYQIKLWDYKDTKVQILDIGGQSIFREYWDSYFDKADGIIYVYDLSLKMSSSYLEDIVKNSDIPILVFGNKVDLIDSKGEEDEIKDGFMHVKCSGTKGINLEKGMDWLISECKKRGIKQ